MDLNEGLEVNIDAFEMWCFIRIDKISGRTKLKVMKY